MLLETPTWSVMRFWGHQYQVQLFVRDIKMEFNFVVLDNELECNFGFGDTKIQ